jgi:AraC family transcriptional regulator, regulatory protein of adaptative response / methylated-DNA-[protein]-cysteine methyltransferase
MSEHIRYGWGQSSLGEFVTAASPHGLVAFEFADERAPLIETLRLRLPTASLRQDDEALRETIGKLAALIDRPEHDPGLTLDMRGTDYEKRVWNVLREIPAGRTTSYGDIAAKLGAPREAREVAEACAANAIAILIPCHRVVKKDGSLSGYRWGFRRKRALLEREHGNMVRQAA